MSFSEQRARTWTLAGVLSLAFHVVLLAVWSGLHSLTSDSPEPAAAAPVPAVSQEIGPATPTPAAPPVRNAPSPEPSAPPVPPISRPAPVSATPSWVDRAPLEEPARASARANPPVSAQPVRPAQEASRPASDAAPKYYVVKRGDNLTRIAARDGSTIAELAKLNGTTVKKLSNLWVGQKIRLKNGIE